MVPEENGRALDPDKLRRLVRPQTKAIVLNTPHNPTGYLMSRADFESVNRFAKEHDLLAPANSWQRLLCETDTSRWIDI